MKSFLHTLLLFTNFIVLFFSSSDSPDLIKPVPIEKCLSCNKHFDADLNHKCLTESEPSNIFHCIGCAHRFGSLDAFNKHVIHVHNDNIDNMFFKTTEEFELWKKRMETIVKHKYLTLSKGTAYKYFTCNFVSPRNTFNTTYLCPSLIMAKYLGTGIQIHYNKTHNGHSCPKYVVPQEFSEYMTNKSKILSPFDSLIEKKPPEDIQQEIYKKYFDLMGNIRKDAAKVDTAILKKLFDSALKMQALINSSEEDNKEEDALFSKSMTDDQITNILEEKRTSTRLKRKSVTRSSTDIKKVKGDDDIATTSKENKEFDSPKLKAKLFSSLSPSFNDSYKEFINSNDNQTKTKKSKEIVKTKIGQFSPKKKVVNTDELKRSPLKPSVTNTKDIIYEVREQDNDCNILVLKI